MVRPYRRYQIFLKSAKGPIDMFLVQQQSQRRHQKDSRTKAPPHDNGASSCGGAVESSFMSSRGATHQCSDAALPPGDNGCTHVDPLLLTPGRIDPAVFYSLEETAAGVADIFDFPHISPDAK